MGDLEFRYSARENYQVHLEILQPVENGWIIKYCDKYG